MDTSETYIKMRIAAIPDMGNGIPMLSTFRSENHHVVDKEDYDVWIDPKGDWYVFREDIPPGRHGDYDSVRVCQLERQDQLQAMVNLSPLPLILLFSSYVKDVPVYGMEWSMEQLWLAFYMKQQYDKIWYNGEWVAPAVLG